MPVALWIGCLCAATTLGGSSPPSWSPDGRWLAYVQPVRSLDIPVEPGWLFRTVPVADDSRRPQAYAESKLWAVCPETGDSLILDQGSGPLTPPSWNHEGSRIAFGRIASEPDGSARWEIVVQDGPARKRVVYREGIAGARPSADALQDLAPQWSPDGRTLAVTTFKTPGVSLIHAENGQLVRFLQGAAHPKWSPEDGRLAFFRGADATVLHLLDAILLEPRRLADVPADRDHLPGPFWSRDGQAVLVLRRGGSLKNQTPHVEEIKLLRIRADTGQNESVIDLAHDPIAKEGGLWGFWMASATESDTFYYAAASPSQKQSRITWCLNRADHVQKQLNPFDFSSMVSALATTPDGGTLAFRVGEDGRWSPPAILDPVSEKMVCVAPDEATRTEWIGQILDAMMPIFRAKLSSPGAIHGKPADRPSLLPVPDEFGPKDETILRLKRLSRLALPLVGTSSPRNDELRLAFAYLSEDYGQALQAADALSARAEETDLRRRLLGVRAQILLAQREFALARPLIAYLREPALRANFQVEENVGRSRLVPMVDSQSTWTELLYEKLEILRKLSPESDKDEMDEGDDRPSNRRAFFQNEGPPAPPLPLAPAGNP